MRHGAETRTGPHARALAEMARLAALHREAEETARLANLLGRAPYAGGAVLALAAGFATSLTVLTARTPPSPPGWC